MTSNNINALSTRVHDIIRRLNDNLSQVETTKTCYGILAIMSREDSSKLIIAKNGMDIILNGMQAHIDRIDVQEAGCDLIWSLAFNNSTVKEIFGNYYGTGVIVRAMKKHSNSPEFLKSACGALSNLCQVKANQQGVASHGGMQPLINSIIAHQDNSKLLPFIFDALASIIVGNEENAKIMSSLDGINRILSTTVLHKEVPEIVKSGFHALAILSDVKGQASKIALAGGVGHILPLLDVHPSYVDFHRVAAVVLLRMLQEASHAVKEIVSHDGVRILLKSLDKGGAQQDTVAATTHILSTVTNPLTAVTSNIESQLWVQQRADSNPNEMSPQVVANLRKGRYQRNESKYVLSTSDNMNNVGTFVGVNGPVIIKPQQPSRRDTVPVVDTLAVNGLLRLLGQYSDRKDVTRASCRFINNISGYNNVAQALDRLVICDRLLECVHIHRTNKDIIENVSNIIKTIHKKVVPTFTGSRIQAIRGLLHLIRCKATDEEAAVACFDVLNRLLEKDCQKGHGNVPPANIPYYTQWEGEALGIITGVFETMIFYNNGGNETSAADYDMKSSVVNANCIHWNKGTPRYINCCLEFLEILMCNRRPDSRSRYPQSLNLVLQTLCGLIPPRYSDIAARIERLLPHIQTFTFEDSNEMIDSNSEHLRRDSATSKLATAVEVLEEQQSNGMLSKSGKVSTLRSHHAAAKALDDCEVPLKRSAMRDAKGCFSPLRLTPNGDVDEKTLPRLKKEAYDNSAGGGERGSTFAIENLLAVWPDELEVMSKNASMRIDANLSVEGLKDLGIQSTDAHKESRMHVVYEGLRPGGTDIVSRCAAPLPYYPPSEGVGDQFSHSITFDSEFESGNLHLAVQRGEAEYDLFLRSDIHTHGHTQWFYFSVSNLSPVTTGRVKIKFNIINLTKPDSLFNFGMKPVMYSFKDAKNKGIGWVRAGTDLAYYRNSYARNNNAGEGIDSYYTLTFSIEFSDPQDTYLIAYSYPYTYSDHINHIKQLVEKPNAKDIIRQIKLCQTLGGNDCDLLIITNFKDPDNIGPLYNSPYQMKLNGQVDDISLKKKKKNRNCRKGLVISCRVHPGETPASWMMKGVLDFLTSDSPNAILLRQTYVVYCVPMLNPDGVIFGNNRCGLAGVDLNRMWRQPLRSLHPTIYYLKSLMQEQKQYREISMYIDIHGHSRRHNLFMIGCDEKKFPNAKARDFPKFFSQHPVGQKYFCYEDCTFTIRKGREGTGRVVVAKELNVPLSFTLEATFCGLNSGALKNYHMHIGHLIESGIAMCDAIIQYAISEGDIPEITTIPKATPGILGTRETLPSIINASMSKEVTEISAPSSIDFAESKVNNDDNESDSDGSCSDDEDDGNINGGEGSLVFDEGAEYEDNDNEDEDNMVLSKELQHITIDNTRESRSANSTQSLDLTSVNHRDHSSKLANIDPSTGFKLLAKDDGFSFPNTVVANRMIVEMNGFSSTDTGKLKAIGLLKQQAISLRPKKISRKAATGKKKKKKDPKNLSDLFAPSAQSSSATSNMGFLEFPLPTSSNNQATYATSISTKEKKSQFEELKITKMKSVDEYSTNLPRL